MKSDEISDETASESATKAVETCLAHLLLALQPVARAHRAAALEMRAETSELFRALGQDTPAHGP